MSDENDVAASVKRLLEHAQNSKTPHEKLREQAHTMTNGGVDVVRALSTLCRTSTGKAGIEARRTLDGLGFTQGEVDSLSDEDIQLRLPKR